MADYTSKTGLDFEERYKHRNISNYPGSESFKELVDKYSGEINLYLQTGGANIEDTYGTLKDVVNELIEYHLGWMEDEHDEDIPHRPEPSLFHKILTHIREKLDFVGGEDVGDEVAFNVDMTKTSGGFEF